MRRADELRQLHAELAYLTDEIERLRVQGRELIERQTILATRRRLLFERLEALTTPQRVAYMTLPRAILYAFEYGPETMTATEVRDRLLALGYDLSKYKNPMAGIHTNLQRLVKNQQLCRTKARGRSAYRHKGE